MSGETCPECKGRGTVVTIMMSEFPVPIRCDDCGGTGKITEPGQKN